MSMTEIQTIYEKAMTAKIEIARDLMREKDQFASFFLLDPDGYKIEVSWHKE